MHSRTAQFIAACAGMLFFGMTLITLGSLALDLRQKFDLDDIQAGKLFAVLPFGILGGSLIFGPICDRYGYKALLIIASLGMFAGFEGIAFSETLFILQVCIFIIGLSGGIINGATNALVSDISDKNKGANLSILGVFFGLGALGMPLILGLVSKSFTAFEVIAATGFLTLFAAIYFAFIRFPVPKLHKAIAKQNTKQLFSTLLILIAFFLFFQSSLEAIINNWTTTYLTERGVMSSILALYALSIHIAGMIIMRLLTGTLFRSISLVIVMWICLVMLVSGIALMQLGTSEIMIILGLFLSGAGVAGGFPIMLGFVGERFSNLSGTAFSFVFTLALIGNMMINYLMGIIVDRYGVSQLATVSYIEIALMAVLFFFIIQKLTSNK
ncbi:MAG TPA: MFS transporter [Chitinophagaceae bacterium]